MRLERAGEGDLPFIMRTERLDGYDRVVGRWDAERHGQALADGRHAYFVVRDDSGDPAGFAIVRDWNSPERVSCVKRVAVARPGRGLGRRFMRLLTDEVFGTTAVFRLWLGVYPENIRARRAYESAGFAAEGIARGSAFFGGEHRDELVMAVLRPDWLARRQTE